MPNSTTEHNKNIELVEPASPVELVKPTEQIEPFTIYKFGIMVNFLDLSQRGFHIVKQLNKIVDSDYRFSPIVFYKEYAKSVDVNRFCALLEKEAWGYDGIVIATDLETAETLINCPCPQKKFFYVWDLEWLYSTYHHQYLKNIYLSDIELIARNKDHADIIKKCWKAPRYTMDNFGAETLKQIVQENYTGGRNE